MKQTKILMAGVLLALAALGQGSDGQVEVMVNQIGSVPVAGVSLVDFKFAIITEDGQQASAEAMVSNGVLTGLSISDHGSSYTTAPKVTISGGGGSGAAATAVVNAGKVAALTIVSVGSGYTTAPYVTIAAPSAKSVVTTLWSNDLTSVGGSEPAAAVTLQVVNKTYSALLGYTGLPNMAALPREVLGNLDARVRVWRRSGKTFKRIIPDRPLATVPYAETASYAQSAGTVSAGSITAASLQDGSVTADKLAPGVLVGTQGSAPLLTSLSPVDGQLTSQGYSRVQTIPGNEWVSPADPTAPSPRLRHSVLWTGTTMIVWGGEVSGQLSNQGGEYSPDTKKWSLISTVNAPDARRDHTAVFTGSRFLIWGGANNANPGGTASGGIFIAATRSWHALSTVSAPSPRYQHSAVWAGDRMIVWGGNSPDGVRADGGAFFPPAEGAPANDTGSWTSLPDSPAAGARWGHTAIWTGSKVIIWGGMDANRDLLNTGAVFDPATGQWTVLPALNAPSARFGHSALWTGSRMLIFGGAGAQLPNNAQVYNDGASFDPVTNQWTPMTSQSAPEPRLHHGAVWTGSEMLVFSGEGASAQILSAGAFNPVTNSWRSLPAAAAAATHLAGVWSGRALLTFGLAGLGTLDPTPTLYLYGRF